MRHCFHVFADSARMKIIAITSGVRCSEAARPAQRREHVAGLPHDALGNSRFLAAPLPQRKPAKADLPPWRRPALAATVDW